MFACDMHCKQRIEYHHILNTLVNYVSAVTFLVVELAFEFIPQEVAPRQASSCRRLTRLVGCTSTVSAWSQHLHVPYNYNYNPYSPYHLNFACNPELAVTTSIASA